MDLKEKLYAYNDKINELDKERLSCEQRLEDIAEIVSERRRELSKQIIKNQDNYKSEDEKNKAYVDLIQKNTILKDLQKENGDINTRLKYIIADRQDNERRIKIEAIIKGVRL